MNLFGIPGRSNGATSTPLRAGMGSPCCPAAIYGMQSEAKIRRKIPHQKFGAFSWFRRQNRLEKCGHPPFLWGARNDAFFLADFCRELPAFLTDRHAGQPKDRTWDHCPIPRGYFLQRRRVQDEGASSCGRLVVFANGNGRGGGCPRLGSGTGFGGRQAVVLVDRDMEAGLAEFFFDVD